MTVFAFDTYPSNAELIAACADLGYLRTEWTTLDPTYGYGTFWKVWRPDHLYGTDLAAAKSPGLISLGETQGAGSIDFRDLPFTDRVFDAVVFDPPYKLNGTPDAETDERFGVHLPTRWQDRMALCIAGVAECARVADKMLLVKCQDQVCSGKKRWQTREFAEPAEKQGFRLRDILVKLGGRSQPSHRPCRRCDRTGWGPPESEIVPGLYLDSCAKCEGEGRIEIVQKHALQNGSSLLVLERT